MTHLSEFLKRSNTQELSTRKISELAAKKGYEVSNATVSRYMAGKHPEKPSLEVLQAFAGVLNIPINKLEGLAGMPGSYEPFVLPKKADTLNEAERAAIVHLVDVMVASKLPTSMPGSAIRVLEEIDRERELDRLAKKSWRDNLPTPDQMEYHLGAETPDGEEFRPDIYQNHKMLWERFGKDWQDHYTLAAKKQTPGDDIEEPYT